MLRRDGTQSDGANEETVIARRDGIRIFASCRLLTGLAGDPSVGCSVGIRMRDECGRFRDRALAGE
jgi:hypothetical protein